MITDLHHEPLLGRSSCSRVPTVITHGNYWNHRLQRPMLKREVMSLQGMASIPGKHDDRFYNADIATTFDALSIEDIYHLFGNGMHFQSLGLVILWVLACGIEATPLCPTLGCMCIDHDAEDD